MTPEESQLPPGSFPLRDGNSLEILVNGREIFPAMLAAIHGARASINFETYIYWSGDIGDEFSRALAARAEDGVEVRVVLDWVGCLKMEDKLVDRMVKAGAKVRYFRPLTWHHLRRFNHRSHRKILVADGLVGFVGGVGIADKWTGNAEDKHHWRDNHYRITGPVVNDLQRVFFSHWEADDLPDDSDPRFFPAPLPGGSVRMQAVAAEPSHGRCRIRDSFVAAVGRARRRLGIVTPYFMPGRKLLAALLEARRRGVDIEVLTCGEHIDQDIVRRASRHRWDTLLNDGIRIHEFQPTLLHTKTLLVDDCDVIVGSANFDCRSSLINAEANVRMEDSEVAARHWELFAQDRERSRAVTMDDWRNRGRVKKALDFLAFQFRDQL